MLENLDGIMVIGLDKIKKRANEKGITILEALVSTAIIGIGSKEFNYLRKKKNIEINAFQKTYSILN